MRYIAVYGMLMELPAVYLLYDSPRWSAAFMLLIFTVSVWNGGGFYIEVFGRKYVQPIVNSTLYVLTINTDLNGNWRPCARNWQSAALR